MQAFALAMICCVTLSDFLVQRLNLPPFLKFLPEMFSGVAILYVLVAGTRDRFRLVAPKYWLIFGALVLVVVCGVINNNPGPGPLISGLRFYFRAAPWFFFALVLPMTEEQLKRQLMLLLGLGLVQLPVALAQRYIIWSADRFSGDDVRGTIMDSGILSMFLICVALVWTGFMLKRRIGIVRYAVVFLLLLFPTTINETKVTVLFVPFGLFVTLVLGAEPGKRLRYAGLTLIVLVVFAAIFVPVYDKLEENSPGNPKIEDFFTNEKALNRYVVSQGRGHEAGIGGTRIAHRGESISIPIQYLAKDPVQLAFGLGLGNVSPSQSGKNFEGQYYVLFQSILTISFSFFVLEFGLFGILLIGALNWMIFSDSLVVARQDDSVAGGLAAGWPGIVAIFMVAIFYNNFHFFSSVTYLYWYLSGIICARRMALRRGVSSGTHASPLGRSGRIRQADAPLA
jgi:hypothetical protein